MNVLPRRTSQSPAPSPTMQSSPYLPSSTLLPLPSTSSSGGSSPAYSPSGNASGLSTTSLQRAGSRSSQRSSGNTSGNGGMIPSPRINNTAMLPPSIIPGLGLGLSGGSSAGPSSSAGSTASVSRSGSLSSTPRLLSRRGSTKDKERSGGGFLGRKESVKGKGKARDDSQDRITAVAAASAATAESLRSPIPESESVEVIETPQMTATRDPETGRKMINQYKVLHEIGHGTHGTVRLGQDMTVEIPTSDAADVGLGLSNFTANPFYAIKMVDRVPKRKRLQTLRKPALGSKPTDGAKLVGESEIRKEIAIFKKVNHPNIVKMKEIIDDPEQSKIFMILEYCKGGEICWKEDDGTPALTLGETRRIFRDTLLGLEYLHHQGIIHRDIKPSNLLLAADGTVKISDFGCSHYSEALRVASSQPNPEGDRYVDDIELAKTAGSPAFFAPEMCYSGIEEEDLHPPKRDSLSPVTTPIQELPAFTLRPPSVISEMGERRPSHSDPLTLSPSGRTLNLHRPSAFRTQSSHTIHRRERTPITNAIDVWALGVTLYCLLFGKTPFDAPNEYLLMQVIPTAPFEIPKTMGKERLSTAENVEAKEAVDLLKRLLEKNPAQRISLEQAKRHPFTTRGISDPTAWLASTDPHTQGFVTVSNDEVLGAVTKSSSFREKFRKGIKSIGQKLQILGGTRSRSRSIGDSDTANSSALSITTAHQVGAAPMTAGISGHNSLHSSPHSKFRPRMPSLSRDASPVASPHPQQGSLSRRLSVLGSKFHDQGVPSPRRSTVQLASPALHPISPASPLPPGEMLDRSTSATSFGKSGFFAHRPSLPTGIAATHLVPTTSSKSSVISPLVEEPPPRSPRQAVSTSSFDKSKSTTDLSPPGSMRRRQSSDIDVMGRQRSPSTASSAGMSGLGSKLVRLLSRTGSQRSNRAAGGGGSSSMGSRSRNRGSSVNNGHMATKSDFATGSDIDEHAIASTSAGTSPREPREELSPEESMPRRSQETFASSYSSRHGGGGGLTGLSPGGGIGHSPERMFGGTTPWESRLRTGGGAGSLPPTYARRGSNLSEEWSRAVYEGDEEVDWTEPLPDDDDDDGIMEGGFDDQDQETPMVGVHQGLTPAAPNFNTSTWQAPPFSPDLAKRSPGLGKAGAPGVLALPDTGVHGLGVSADLPISPGTTAGPTGGILEQAGVPSAVDQPTSAWEIPHVVTGHSVTPPTHAHPSAPPSLEAIPDASPPGQTTYTPLTTPSSRRPSTPSSIYGHTKSGGWSQSRPGNNANNATSPAQNAPSSPTLSSHSHNSDQQLHLFRPTSRSSDRSSPGHIHTPYRSTTGKYYPERARSPLGRMNDSDEDIYFNKQGGVNEFGGVNGAIHHHISPTTGLGKPTSPLTSPTRLPVTRSSSGDLRHLAVLHTAAQGAGHIHSPQPTLLGHSPSSSPQSRSHIRDYYNNNNSPTHSRSGSGHHTPIENLSDTGPGAIVADDDDGLAIDLGSRRGRKNSVMSRGRPIVPTVPSSPKGAAAPEHRSVSEHTAIRNTA